MVKTPELSEYDAVDLIQRRTGNYELFNENLIKKIYKISKSPKVLLVNCGKVAELAANKDRKRVQMADLRILK